MPTSKNVTPAAARRLLKRKGHSYRSAASCLGVDFSHLHRVLVGQRPSKRLLGKVMDLPAREEVAK